MRGMVGQPGDTLRSGAGLGDNGVVHAEQDRQGAK